MTGKTLPSLSGQPLRPKMIKTRISGTYKSQFNANFDTAWATLCQNSPKVSKLYSEE